MNLYEVLSWKKEGLFQETHYIRKTSQQRDSLFIHCDTLFESTWFQAYQPPHYAVPQTLYEFILEGSYCHMEKDRMVTELHPGDWIITRLDRQTPGHYDKVFVSPLRRIGILIGSTPVHDMLSQHLFPEKRAVLHADDMACFYPLLQQMKEEIQSDGNEEKISSMMMELIQKIAGLRNRQILPAAGRFPEILQECQSSSWQNTPELAARFGMSERTLTRLFKENLETTPGHYLADVRLEKARVMLSVPGLEIKEIARLCGYSDANFLARCFRKKYRISPREYRAGKKNKA